MASLANLMALLNNGGWAPDVQRTGVSPGYGLAGATIQPQQGSGFERTLKPGEQRTTGSLRDMLAEVILAAGSGALPAVSGGGQARRAPGTRRIPQGTNERHFEAKSPLLEALKDVRTPEPGKWRNYGTDEGARFELQRGQGHKARWIDRTTGLQVGPVQGNIAPAVAYGLHYGLENVATGSNPVEGR